MIPSTTGMRPKMSAGVSHQKTSWPDFAATP
jgi:hypothetical protein